MRFSSHDSYATVRVPFTITEDYPVVPMAYSRPPKLVRIERGSISYALKNGVWVLGSNYSFKMAGTVLKKDGTLSLNDHHRELPGRYEEDREDPMWLWAITLIGLLRPEGGLVVPTFENHEIGDVLG